MVDTRDLYEVLGVSTGTTSEELKAAYRRLAQSYHPDKGQADPEIFIQIKAAYEVLSDPERRAAYDAGGNTDPRADRIRNTALRDLAGLLLAIVEQCDDPATTDILGSIRRTVENSKAQGAAAMQEMSHSINKLCTTISRMHIAEGQTNVLAESLRAHVARKENELAQLQELQDTRSLILEMVEPYVYEMQRTSMWYSATTSTF